MYPCFTESVIKVPKAPPIAPIHGLNVEKSKGITTAGRNCPIPQGLSIYAVKYAATA